MGDYVVQRDNRPVFALGLNYWARHTGPMMWRCWDPEKVKMDVAQMRQLGCNVCRAFLFTPDFAPQPNVLDPQALERLGQFLDFCEQADVGVFLTLLVGHMSCENWHPGWLVGRDIYRDAEAVQWQAWYCGEIVRRYRSHSAIVGWVVTNEITNYAPVPDATSGLAWAEKLVAAIRQNDPTRPIGIGDGAWEVHGGDNGLRMDDLEHLLDFFGPHTYHLESDELRHSQVVPFLTELCRRGRPVLLEEFGASTTHCSPENQALYYRETLHSAFLAGAAGALGWCYSDFDLPHQRPYSHHAHELRFGVTDIHGEIKPAGKEVERFSRLLQGIDLRQWRRAERHAAVVVPSFQTTWRYPFNAPDLKAVNGVLLESYVLARQTNLPVELFREPPVGDAGESPSWDFPERLRLLFMPHCQSLTAPGYEALERFVERGGLAYYSFHIDPSCPSFEKLFGCRHRLRYGLIESPADVVKLHFVAPFGSLQQGDAISIRSAGMPRRASYCPVEPTSATVLAVDQEGRPALMENRMGQGGIVFSAYPLEYYLWNTPGVHEADSTHLLYRALRQRADLEPPFDVEDPWIELSWIEGPEGFLLWVLNRSWQPRGVNLHFQGSLFDFQTALPVGPHLVLEPKEVRVLRVHP